MDPTTSTPKVVLKEPSNHLIHVLVMALLGCALAALICFFMWRILKAWTHKVAKLSFSDVQSTQGTLTTVAPSMNYQSVARQIAQSAASWSADGSASVLRPEPPSTSGGDLSAKSNSGGRVDQSTPVNDSGGTETPRPVPAPRQPSSGETQPTPKPRRPDLLAILSGKPAPRRRGVDSPKQSTPTQMKSPFFTPQTSMMMAPGSSPAKGSVERSQFSLTLDTPGDSTDLKLDEAGQETPSDAETAFGTPADQLASSLATNNTIEEEKTYPSRDQYASYEDMRSPAAAVAAEKSPTVDTTHQRHRSAEQPTSQKTSSKSKSQNSLLASLSSRKRSVTDQPPQHDVVAHLRQSSNISVTSTASMPLPNSAQAENARYVPYPVGTSPRASQQQIQQDASTGDLAG